MEVEKRITVGTFPVRLDQEGAPKLFREVWAKALSTNTGIVYIGTDDQVVVNGYELEAGEELQIPIDLFEETWAEASEVDQEVRLIFT